MAAGNPGRAPAAHGGNRGGSRGGNRGPGRGGNRGPFAGGLYNPSQPLQGRALYRAAQGIANAQVTGPMRELSAQIARQNQQTHAAQQQTFGYYMQLAKEAQDAVNQEKGISGDLSGQLQGVNQQTQQQLAQFGQQAQGGALSTMAGLGLGAGQQQALQSEAARQQGMAGLNAQTFQSAGANQGANYTGAAASNLGTFALRGQERLGDIGRAGQLANFPLTTKQASLAASRGALTATALGQLRSSERNYQIAQRGLGIKGQALRLTAAQDRAKNALSLSDQQLRARIASINAQLASGRLSETKRHDLATEKTAAQRALRSGGGGGLPKTTPTGTPTLTPYEQQRDFGEIDTIRSSLIDQMRQPLSATVAKSLGLPAGTRLSEAQIRRYLVSGPNPARARYTPAEVDAAFALKGWGYLTPRQITALNKQGLIVGNRYKRGQVPKQKTGALGGSLFGVPV